MKKGSNNKYANVGTGTLYVSYDKKYGIIVDENLNQLPIQVTLNMIEKFTNQFVDSEDDIPKKMIAAGTIYGVLQLLKKRVGDDEAYRMNGEIINRIPKMLAICDAKRNN